MMKKSLFVELGGFDKSLPTCEDYDLWLRITAKHDVGFVRKTLVTKFGGHADQLSKAFPVMDRYRISVLEKILLSGLLSAEQQQWTREELARKKAIVLRGSRKRSA
jgi:hypothetical protein